MMVGIAVASIVWLLSASGSGCPHRLREANWPKRSGVGRTWPRASRPRANQDGFRFAEVAALLRAGVPPAVAWQRATGVAVDALGIPDQVQLERIVAPAAASAMVSAARLATQVGAPLAMVLQTVGDALRVDEEMQAERKTALAGPQTTARVLLALPLLGLALGWVLGANPVRTITGGGVGTISFFAGGAMLLAGRGWISRLVTAAADQGKSLDGG